MNYAKIDIEDGCTVVRITDKEIDGYHITDLEWSHLDTGTGAISIRYTDYHWVYNKPDAMTGSIYADIKDLVCEDFMKKEIIQIRGFKKYKNWLMQLWYGDYIGIIGEEVVMMPKHGWIRLNFPPQRVVITTSHYRIEERFINT